MPTTPSRPGPGHRPVQAVTTARASVERDRARRMWEYLLAMGFRILAFPASVWLLLNDREVLGVLLAGAAVVIPSIAVVLANNVDRRGSARGPTPVRDATPRLEEGAPSGPDAPGQAEPIRGTVVSSKEQRRDDDRRHDGRGREAS